MPGTIENISAILFKKLSEEELSPAAQAILDVWLSASEDNRQTLSRLQDEGHLKNDLLALSAHTKGLENAWELFKATNISQKPTAAPIHFLRTAWLRYAAVIILLFGTAAWLWFKAGNESGRHSKQNAIPVAHTRNDANKATLTLADGSTILLNGAAEGDLARQGETKILKLNAGQLAYRTDDMAGNKESGYNTISTPRGGQYQVTLADGSNVWLNAASSIRLPVHFSDKERMVEVTGEAYFEIAPDSKRPFFVRSGAAQVQVLGTSFNINAYADEQALVATLVTGSVKVLQGNATALLKPGQQAVIAYTVASEPPVQVQPADLNSAIAWKNGVFKFNEQTVDGIMRQLARWYDLDIKYDTGTDIHKRFVATISRNESVEKAFDILEMIQVGRFKISGRTVTVLPYGPHR